MTDDVRPTGVGKQQRTPVGATPIVLNPKLSGDATPLCCPNCGEEIQCTSPNKEGVFEYRCGCPNLRKFKIKGVENGE
jgi:hypothetical protein